MPRSVSSDRRRVGAILAMMVAASAAAPAEATTPVELVEQGRRLFFNETFAGNGRTCGTCHPADNNYTIDPAYIARLPASDPLFVFERVPALRGLEHAVLLRQLALVTVHADGLGNPTVVRSVQHTLGLRRSITADPFSLVPADGDRGLIAATGWSGDGAPGAGSLKEFALGAIREHMPKSLRRVPGVDFRLPTEQELEALRAFMLSLGRQDEVDISDATGLRFTSPQVERGRQLFNSEASGSCNFCHNNAGAMNDAGVNGMFDTGVARRLGTPALRLDPALAGDGGFGASPRQGQGSRAGRGDGRMNVPSLIEAADTPPFFHDNSAATLEQAITFYTTPAFARSPEGQTLPTIDLTRADVRAIGAMLRTLNALENIRNADALTAGTPGRDAVRLASLDTMDAIQVLTGAPLPLYPGAVDLLRQALALERQAAQTAADAQRRRLVREASALKQRSRSQMVR